MIRLNFNDLSHPEYRPLLKWVRIKRAVQSRRTVKDAPHAYKVDGSSRSKVKCKQQKYEKEMDEPKEPSNIIPESRRFDVTRRKSQKSLDESHRNESTFLRTFLELWIVKKKVAVQKDENCNSCEERVFEFSLTIASLDRREQCKTKK